MGSAVSCERHGSSARQKRFASAWRSRSCRWNDGRTSVVLPPYVRHLDDAALGVAWAEGRALTLEQAIAYALDEGAGVETIVEV